MSRQKDEQRRRRVYYDMNPELKKVAQDFAAFLRRLTRDFILTYREMGLSIVEVVNDESQFGENAIKKLAAYAGLEPQFLLNLAKLAKAFSEERLEDLVKTLPATRHRTRQFQRS